MHNISKMAPKKKILEEILPVRIIREVEKWPVLYMRDCPEMPNTHFKNKVWNEIAKALIENWDTYSQAEKKSKIMDLIKKWRNLRDAFKRQILLDKKIREGHNIKKKKYVYYKHMSFLLPHMQLEEPPAPSPPASASPPPPAPRRTRAHASAQRDARRTAHQHRHDALLNAEHIDEDKHFLMSLLPSLQRMNDDEKLTAKMEILNVLKNVRKLSAETYVCQLQVSDDDQLDVKTELVSDVDADDPDVDSDAELSECSEPGGHTD